MHGVWWSRAPIGIVPVVLLPLACSVMPDVWYAWCLVSSCPAVVTAALWSQDFPDQTGKLLKIRGASGAPPQGDTIRWPPVGGAQRVRPEIQDSNTILQMFHPPKSPQAAPHIPPGLAPCRAMPRKLAFFRFQKKT